MSHTASQFQYHFVGLPQTLSRHCLCVQEALRRGAAQALAALPGAVAPDALLGALAGALGAARSTRAQVAVLDFYAVLARTRALAGDPPSPAALKCARPAGSYIFRVWGCWAPRAARARARWPATRPAPQRSSAPALRWLMNLGFGVLDGVVVILRAQHAVHARLRMRVGSLAACHYAS